MGQEATCAPKIRSPYNTTLRKQHRRCLTHRMSAGSHDHQGVLAHVPGLAHQIQLLGALRLCEERLGGQKSFQLDEQVAEELRRTTLKLLRDHTSLPVSHASYINHVIDVAQDN